MDITWKGLNNGDYCKIGMFLGRLYSQLLNNRSAFGYKDLYELVPDSDEDELKKWCSTEYQLDSNDAHVSTYLDTVGKYDCLYISKCMYNFTS